MNDKIKAVQMDLARQKENLKEIFRFFDFANKCGYNTVVLYLEDRIKTEFYHYSDDIDSYSIDEVKKIVNYADSLNLELIPVVSNFGHAERFLRHEELKYMAELRGNIPDRFGNVSGNYNDVCPSMEQTYAFFDHYITEIASLFPSKYFHVGLDEMFNIGLCKLCKEREGGLSAIFAEHINRTHTLLTSLGKRMLMWEDMFEICPEALMQIPNDIIICVWNYRYIDRYFSGHFNGSLKQDLFEKFSALGFELIACMHTNISNIDSYSYYAERYETLGTLITIWERSREQLLYLYPYVAYAGLKMQGATDTAETLKAAIRLVFDTADEIFVSAAANLSQYHMNFPICNSFDPNVLISPDRIDKISLLNKELTLDTFNKATPNELKNNPTLLSIASHLSLDILTAKLHFTHSELWDYQSGIKKAGLDKIKCDLSKLLEEAKSQYELQSNLWDICRHGLPSPDMDKCYTEVIDFAEKLTLIANAASFGEKSVLSVSFFVPDPQNIPMSSVELYYDDSTIYTAYQGSFKQVDLEIKNSYFTVNFFIPNKTPAKCRFIGYGYGGVGITYLELCVNGKNIRPYAVGEIIGNVTKPQNALENDSAWCFMGEENMRRCVKNHEITTQKNSVEFFLE